MKNLKFTFFKSLLVLIGVLMTSLTTPMWADTQFDNVYIYYSLDGGTTETGYSCNSSYGDFANYAVVTSELIITQVYYRYRKYNGNVCGTQMVYWDGSNDCYYGYKTDGYYENCWEWGGEYVGSEQRNTSYNFSVSTAQKASGIYEFYYCWQMWGGLSANNVCTHNWYMPDKVTKYTLHYTINPPAVDDFDVSEANHLSGSGTEDDPYVLPYDGTLSLTVSGKQKHTDGNSSAQYYNTSSNNAWSTTATKSIPNVTSYDKTSVTVKMRYRNGSTCYNGTSDNLVGEESTKTIWYKAASWNIAGDMNSWNTHTTPLVHSSGSTYSKSISLDANDEIAFKIVDNQNSKWYTKSTTGATVNLIYPDNNGYSYPYNNTAGNGNTILKTAGAGLYTFTWDESSKYLAVDYPTSYTVTFGYGTGGSEVTASGSNSGDITSEQYVASGENVTFTQTAETGYTFKGWYTTEDGNTAVSTMGENDHVLNGINANKTVYAQYTPKEYTISLDPALSSSPGTAGTEEVTAIFNSDENISDVITRPTREGYTFLGYFDDSDHQVIDENGAFTTAGGYIDGDGKWVEDMDEDLELTAQWEDTHEYYYKGASASGWATASNWTRGAVPGSGDDVILLKPIETPAGTTTVNSIRIATSGSYTPADGSAISASGSLTVSAGTALKVTTNVQNCVITDNAPASVGSTTSSTLMVRAAGALAWGSAGSPGDATVVFATRSGGANGSSKAVNQYFGIPFTTLNSDVFDDAWVFAVNGLSWGEIQDYDMSPWTGYNIILKLDKDEDLHYQSYALSGTLLGSNASLGSGVTAGSETLYANSWVAPIEISKIGFSGTGTIYIFSAQSSESIVSESNPVGNYTAHSINESSGSYIPSMQSFSIISGTSISINYATAVYGQITSGANANYAPRREREYDYREAIWATQDTLTMDVKSANGWSDKLKMFIHEDFSMDYENGWDGPKMEGMWEAPMLYALNNEGQMAVSCVPTANNNVIGFHAGTASNEYTFTFKYSGEEELYLRDTKTNVETRISAENSYTFTSESGDSDMRFVIINRAPATTTGVEETNTENNVQKIMYNGAMYIIRGGRIYSAEGAFVK